MKVFQQLEQTIRFFGPRNLYKVTNWLLYSLTHTLVYSIPSDMCRDSVCLSCYHREPQYRTNFGNSAKMDNSLALMSYTVVSKSHYIPPHDITITWKHFPHHWPFVKKILFIKRPEIIVCLIACAGQQQLWCDIYPLLNFCEGIELTSWFPHKMSVLRKAFYIDGLVQERRNSIANALELRLSYTHPSIWWHHHAFQLFYFMLYDRCLYGKVMAAPAGTNTTMRHILRLSEGHADSLCRTCAGCIMSTDGCLSASAASNGIPTGKTVLS